MEGVKGRGEEVRIGIVVVRAAVAMCSIEGLCEERVVDERRVDWLEEQVQAGFSRGVVVVVAAEWL